MVMDFMEHDLKGLMHVMSNPFTASEVKRLMLDLLLAQREGRRAVHRVAVCSQEWQPADVPPEARYHLMWRAVARAHARRPNASGAFRLAKDFEYRGHFPCSASAPPAGVGRA